MKLVKATNGLHNLFVWRDGEEFFRMKNSIFLNEFTNVKFDVAPQPPDSPMLFCDITQRLPFADQSFDHVNCYHVYEHLLHREAEFFTSEIFRVLKPGGIYR